jgi:hypothetical protein
MCVHPAGVMYARDDACIENTAAVHMYLDAGICPVNAKYSYSYAHNLLIHAHICGDAAAA